VEGFTHLLTMHASCETMCQLSIEVWGAWHTSLAPNMWGEVSQPQNPLTKRADIQITNPPDSDSPAAAACLRLLDAALPAHLPAWPAL
jgi:hypothetical protein